MFKRNNLFISVQQKEEISQESVTSPKLSGETNIVVPVQAEVPAEASGRGEWPLDVDVVMTSIYLSRGGWSARI